MDVNWNVAIATGGGAGLEFLETAAIAYAIARSGFIREAILGSVVGLSGVGLAAIVLGASLQGVPLHGLQVGIGALLLIFGGGWVKKGVVRYAQGRRAGWLSDDPLLAEGIVLGGSTQAFSPLNFIVMVKSAALEALEVAVIVITLGLASQAWTEIFGATLVALLGSLVLVALLHRYLRWVPDVLIKLGTGILLCTLGTFWLGEGLGVEWWLGDWAIVAIALLYSLFATLSSYWLKRQLFLSLPDSTSNESP